MPDPRDDIWADDGQDERIVEACPECDRTAVEGRGPYRCTRCGATFQEPNERPDHRHDPENHGRLLFDSDTLDQVREQMGIDTGDDDD